MKNVLGWSLILVTLVLGCRNSSNSTAGSTDLDTTTASVAAGAFAGATSSSSSGGALGLAIGTVTACPTASVSHCSGSVMTLAYNNCSFSGSAAVWNGGSQVLNFTTGSCAWPPASSSIFNRTFSAATTRTSLLGNVITFQNSSTASGYSTSVSGGTTVTVSTFPARTINILGMNVIAADGNGTVLWNHSISTPVALTIDSTGSVTSGILLLQHNLAHFTATTTIAQTVTFTTGCVYPTGGQINIVFAGSKSGSETLTFLSTCGTGQVVASDGTSANITYDYVL